MKRFLSVWVMAALFCWVGVAAAETAPAPAKTSSHATGSVSPKPAVHKAAKKPLPRLFKQKKAA